MVSHSGTGTAAELEAQLISTYPVSWTVGTTPLETMADTSLSHRGAHVPSGTHAFSPTLPSLLKTRPRSSPAAAGQQQQASSSDSPGPGAAAAAAPRGPKTRRHAYCFELRRNLLRAGKDSSRKQNPEHDGNYFYAFLGTVCPAAARGKWPASHIRPGGSQSGRNHLHGVSPDISSYVNISYKTPILRVGRPSLGSRCAIDRAKPG